jgi:predicted alpha/beta hydrolase family esterase
LSGSDDSRISPKLLVSQAAHLLLQLFGTGDISSPMLANGGMPELSTIKRFQDKPLIVMGWSMGGVIASNFALMYPSLVQRLVLVAPAGFPVVKPPTTLVRIQHIQRLTRSPNPHAAHFDY